MNIVPNLHSTLISVPKMAAYIAVFDKTETKIYDGTTTMITALGEPIIVAPRCEDTGAMENEPRSGLQNSGSHELRPIHRRSRCGQCNFRFTQLSAIAYVFPRSGRISNKRNIHGCSPSWQLRDVARAHNHTHL
jgi:hypothetical protein